MDTRKTSVGQRGLLCGLLLAGGACAAEPAGPLAAAAADSATPPLRKVDICVYGATPSGLLAAVAAQRAGKAVLIVEPGRWVGGMLGAGIKPQEDCPMPQAVGGMARQVVLSFGRAPPATRAAFLRLLAEHQTPVLYEHRVCGLDKQGARITRLRLEQAPPDRWGGPVARARAGVAYAIGRESREQYGEEHAGVSRLTNVTPLDPYVKPGDPSSGLLPGVEPDHGKPLGAADDYTQAYNFRYYVTANPRHRVPFTPPEDYAPEQFELVGRYVEYLVAQAARTGGKPPLDKIFPGWMNAGEYNYFRQSLFSIAPLGVSRAYQDGGYATRAALWQAHRDYLRGLHHFMMTDPRVPREYRDKVTQLGLDRTQHPDTEGWPHQLYIRVARRMVGRYVLTEADVMNRTTVNDAIGLALYGVDTYPARRIVVRAAHSGRVAVATEGNMFIGGNRGTGVPYGVPYRAITPREDQCVNLLVPVCFSASYIAYASARMEPVFMVLGESAGMAAAQALDEQAAVQNINVARLQASLRARGQIIAWPDKLKKAP